MTDDEKCEHAEAIKHALGKGYGPPMEGEEGWVPPVAMLPDALPDEDDGLDVFYSVAEEERRQKQERKLAKERKAAAEPNPAPPCGSGGCDWPPEVEKETHVREAGR